jgi:hypothetical protein
MTKYTLDGVSIFSDDLCIAMIPNPYNKSRVGDTPTEDQAKQFAQLIVDALNSYEVK